ncbi:30S ribosomal protein S20 [candidate division LCP-89 bacterium B3_LCP]|uniref:Small ribosomal subunit protein bS20 n=1 Tax=candidate division LCP-89 bacterium B3_LCP TaxID=2012998 RepID=A0A532UZB9_UNCL8|nr:MAG: 30S ribosomal protein S20 [candidate division LCP-89 bacterium B3_LCP]
MPQHKSCKKRVKTSAISRESNRTYRSQVKTLVRQIKEAKDPESTQASLRQAISHLDRLAQKGIVHKNKAANQKSKLSKLANKMTQVSNHSRVLTDEGV